MKPPPAVQAELLAGHHHAPHPPVGLAPAAWNMEESINKSFLFRYFHYDRLIDTLIFQLAVTPNASLSAIYIHLPTAGGILGPQVLSGLVLLSSEISFSRQLLRNIPGPERRGRTSKLKLKAQGLQRTPKAKDMGYRYISFEFLGYNRDIPSLFWPWYKIWHLSQSWGYFYKSGRIHVGGGREIFFINPLPWEVFDPIP